jgi:hypothetical protein
MLLGPNMNRKPILPVLAIAVFCAACQPKVQIVPSEKPIVIELNVNINQEIRVRLDQDVEDLISENPDLF